MVSSLSLRVVCDVTISNSYSAPPLIHKLGKQVMVKLHGQYMMDQSRDMKIILKEENANKT